MMVMTTDHLSVTNNVLRHPIQKAYEECFAIIIPQQRLTPAAAQINHKRQHDPFHGP
jgi:hypothetical protein